MARATNALGTIRELSGRDADLHREHLLRLDAEGRRERFNGVAGDHFIRDYAARCFAGRTRVFAFIDAQGVVRGAAELHAPEKGEPADIAFSVEPAFRQSGIGSRLFEVVIAAARYSRFPSCASPPPPAIAPCGRWPASSGPASPSRRVRSSVSSGST